MTDNRLPIAYYNVFKSFWVIKKLGYKFIKTKKIIFSRFFLFKKKHEKTPQQHSINLLTFKHLKITKKKN